MRTEFERSYAECEVQLVQDRNTQEHAEVISVH